MNKQHFLECLRDGLVGLPPEEREERVSFCGEMIDDRMEEGLSEAEAVAAMGSLETLIEGIAADVSLVTLVKERVRPKGARRVWEIVLLAVGSPLWISLLITAAAVVFSLFISLWAVIVSCWSVPASLAAAGLGGIVGGTWLSFAGHLPSGVAMVAAAFVCGGLGIFAVYGCKAITKGAARITRRAWLGMKTGLLRKGES